MPTRLRAASITAICMPKQMPKYGTSRSRANCAARILPSAPRWPKPPGTRMPLTCSRNGAGILVLEHLALDPVEIDLHLVGDAAMRQRLDQRFVGVLHAGVFADDGDGHLAFGIADALVDDVPALQRRRNFRRDAERGQHLVVEAGGVIGLRHGVDVVDVARLDHGAFAHVAEQAELAPLFLRDLAVGAAQQDVRLDADRTQFLHRMLGRLCLQFAGARNEGSSVRWM